MPDYANYRVEDISIGDIIKVYPRNDGRGGHGASIQITKINKKTFKGVEIKGSYRPGVNWTVHKEAHFSLQFLGEDRLMKEKWFNY